MPAPTTSTIGTGGTYSSLASWLADMPADITTGAGAGSYSAQLLNQNFSIAGTHLTLTGITTDSSHTITITTATGASFRDNAGAATNALRPNAANGAILTTTGQYTPCIEIGIGNVILRGLQIDNQGGKTDAVQYTTIVTGTLIDACIVRIASVNSTDRVMLVLDNTAIVSNCLIINSGSTGTGVLSFAGTYSDCTFVSFGTGAGNCVVNNYGSPKLTGCAIFGFSAATGGTMDSGSDYCATDLSSLGSGYPATSHNLTSQTYSLQFQNVASYSTSDFRLNTGSALINAGTTISGVSTDIIGTVRPQGTAPDIGCWEVINAPTAHPWWTYATQQIIGGQ